MSQNPTSTAFAKQRFAHPFFVPPPPAARKPVEVVLSIYESSRSGKQVDVADLATRTHKRNGSSLDFTVFPNAHKSPRHEVTRA